MIIGYVDEVYRNHVQGWCIDTELKAQPLDVTVFYGDQEIASARADGPRQDLVDIKMDGEHGFDLYFPAVDDVNRINVRVRSSGDSRILDTLNIFPVRKFGKDGAAPNFMSQLNIDVTNHCNNRCNFCLNDWGKAHNMDLGLFRKILEIFPDHVGTPEGGGAISLSCLYEPTLHPHFIDIVEMIPPKSKFYFTTNLARKFPDSFFERLGASNINLVNISLETFDRDQYLKITRNKNSRFYENLDKLREAFSKIKNPPVVHLITMVTRENYKELPDIAKYGIDWPSMNVHHFRTPYICGYMEKDFVQNSILTQQELDVLRDELLKQGVPCQMLDFRGSREKHIEALQGDYSNDRSQQHVEVWQPYDNEPRFLKRDASHPFPRILSNGYFTVPHSRYAYNLNNISNWSQLIEFLYP